CSSGGPTYGLDSW
nr:immunoglobulin heavy chain junction region [Macaca mulatta]